MPFILGSTTWYFAWVVVLIGILVAATPMFYHRTNQMFSKDVFVQVNPYVDLPSNLGGFLSNFINWLAIYVGYAIVLSTIAAFALIASILALFTTKKRCMEDKEPPLLSN